MSKKALSIALALVLARLVSSCSSDDPARGTSEVVTPRDPVAPPGPPGSLADPPTEAPGPAAAGATAPLLVGRFDTTDPAGPRATWPGARILTRFDGTAVSVTLAERAEDWMEGAPSYWEVRIDKGEWVPVPMIADDQPHVFDLAKDLPKGVHDVELYKRSETQTGMTQFLGFDFHGGTALPPPPRQTRRIEVMGDSQSTGFGVEMTDAPNTDCPGADHGGRWQNFRKAWGARLGERFDAELHGIVYSGKGVIKNVWPTDGDTLVRYYPRTNPNPALQNSDPQLFDLSSWIPDVIVLAQGAMDFNSGVDYGAFRTAYRTFVLDVLRARGKDTHIFMSVLGRGGRAAIPEIAGEIVRERAAVGDDKMHVFVAEDYVWTEMLGCNGHGVASWHQRIADALAIEIGKATGWP
jgi:hypothetical protein